MAKTRKQAPPRRPTKAQQAAAEARRRRDRQRKIVIGIVVGVVVAALLVLGWVTSRPKNQKAAPISTTADASVTCTPDQEFDATTSDGPHVSSEPTYTVNPPAGGNHLIDPAAPGIYDADGAPSDGHIVHSLEHGYVAIWHRPGLPEAELAKLENVWKNFKADVLLVERSSLPEATPVVATAWGNRLVCSGTDDFQVAEFVRQFANQGPERIPHTVPPEGRNPRT